MYVTKTQTKRLCFPQELQNRMEEKAAYTHLQTMAKQRKTTMSMQKTGSQHIPCCFPVTRGFIWRVAGKLSWKHAKGICFSSFIRDLISHWMSLWAWQWRKGRNKNTSFTVELRKIYMISRLVWNYPSPNRLICFFYLKRSLNWGP